MSSDPLQKWTLVRVEWDDTRSDSAWLTRKKAAALTPCRCVNVGWVFHETASHLTLVAGRQVGKGHREVGDAITIPKGCIISVKKWAEDR